MSTTPKSCAHVCTPQRKPQYWFSSGAADFLKGDKRFFVVEAEDSPPENWVGNIVPGTRCSDVTANYWNDPYLSDVIQYEDEENRTICYANRHQHVDPKIRGRWRISLRQFNHGRRWETETQAVTDDFGWLVEVPA